MWVKVCGITTLDDALLAVDAGVSAVGLNFVPSSKRYIVEEQARQIAAAVRGRVALVGVVADSPTSELERLREALDLDYLQLHGSEGIDQVSALLPGAFKAIRIGSAQDAALAEAYPGPMLLADAKAPGQLGGSGAVFDWNLVVGLSAKRKLILAGGLSPDNVASAVATVRPFGVDVASGVERKGEPRRKDPDLVRRFVAAARGAA